VRWRSTGRSPKRALSQQKSPTSPAVVLVDLPIEMIAQFFIELLFDLLTAEKRSAP
jgi:hypothetical protein